MQEKTPKTHATPLHMSQFMIQTSSPKVFHNNTHAEVMSGDASATGKHGYAPGGELKWTTFWGAHVHARDTKYMHTTPHRTLWHDIYIYIQEIELWLKDCAATTICPLAKSSAPALFDTNGEEDARDFEWTYTKEGSWNLGHVTNAEYETMERTSVLIGTAKWRARFVFAKQWRMSFSI